MIEIVISTEYALITVNGVTYVAPIDNFKTFLLWIITKQGYPTIDEFRYQKEQERLKERKQ